MKTIIAPTDFSDASVNAMMYAADIALATDASLQVYHMVPDRVMLVDNMDYDVEYTETEDAMVQLEALQEKIKSYTQHRLNIDVQLKYGNIYLVLKESCNKGVPFAIVMAASEKTAIERFVLGSETLAVSHKIMVPLILVPPGAAFKGINKIAVATDLADVYETIPLDILTSWIEIFKSALDIVFIKDDNRFKANNVAEAVALQTHFKKYFPTMRYIPGDDIAKGINVYLNENAPDLLIMIPKKHTLFHKSLSKQFIIHPTIPTMVLSAHH